MILRICLGGMLALVLAGCQAPQGNPPSGPRTPAPPVVQQIAVPDEITPEVAAQNFISVARRMEPAIEAECAARTQGQGRSCDFQIMVDERPDQAPNAFQTLDQQGRPIVAFNLGLIATARNTDELAFVMGHEAAHHIAAHIPRTQTTALTGAILLGNLVAAAGGSAASIRDAQDIGASVGARAYSQDFELEADELGTVLAWNAGFDPERGAQFFNRLGDPGERFFGSHPGNQRRFAVVRATAARLRAGQPPAS